MTRAEMKTQAREELGNKLFGEKWLMALLLAFIYSSVVGIAGCFFGIGSLIIIGPMTVGYCAALLTVSRKNTTANIGEMFTEGFAKDFGRTLLIGLMETIFITLWSFLLLIPGIVKSYSYSLACYIAVDHPEYDWKQCIDESKRLMNGHKWEMFVLDLSFIGWMIVGSLVLGLGTLWVTPYIEQTKTVFYRNLIGDNNTTYSSEYREI